MLSRLEAWLLAGRRQLWEERSAREVHRLEWLEVELLISYATSFGRSVFKRAREHLWALIAAMERGQAQWVGTV